MEKHSPLDAVFGALADPTRRRIVERLARGPLTAGQIAAGFDLSQPAISKHLRVLERSGLLERQIHGRVHTCRVAPERLEAATKWLELQRAFWNSALDRLNAALTTKGKKS